MSRETLDALRADLTPALAHAFVDKLLEIPAGTTCALVDNNNLRLNAKHMPAAASYVEAHYGPHSYTVMFDRPPSPTRPSTTPQWTSETPANIRLNH